MGSINDLEQSVKNLLGLVRVPTILPPVRCLIHRELMQDLWGDGTPTCETCFLIATQKEDEFTGVSVEDRNDC